MAWNNLTSAQKWTTGLGIANAGLGAIGLIGDTIGTIWNAKQSQKWNEKNYEMQKQQLDYQKYLNANQTQIQTADAQKAGINPLAMNGGTVQAGTYSNVNPAQIDMNGVNSMIESIIGANTAQAQNRAQMEIANKQAETQLEVARINAQSQEQQTQMKIDADTEAQKSQQNWQSYENWEQRIFEMAEKSRDRENARVIADIGASAMVKCANINDELQRYLNQVYEVDPNGNLIKDENGNPKKLSNAVTANIKQAQKQLQAILSAGSLDESYKRQLQMLQEDLIRVQTEAQKAGVKQGWIKTLTGTIDSVTNLIGVIKGY